MEEVWKSCKITNGKYSVSNLGNIKYTNSAFDRTKTHLSNSGYKFISIRIKGKSKSLFVHRLVAKAFIPNPEGKEQVNHIDGNKLNNHINNLEWVTQEENIRHKNNPSNKLTIKLAREVREKIRIGIDRKTIKEQYNISESTLYRTLNNISWSE